MIKNSSYMFKNIFNISGEESSNPFSYPNLTLSVMFGHKYNEQRFSNSSCAESKYKLN